MSSEPETCQEVELSVEGEEIVCETVVLQSEEDDEEDDEHSETLSVEGHRPVRPVERQKMRPWLIDLLDKNILPGLNWQNKKENIFRISWKHAAHNCFNRNRDSDLFERWAVHTGRHHEGNHKRWKANFRCALNSLPDVMELKELGVRKGDNAFKVYKFLDSSEPTMKEKMEIKRKYSLMAGIKLEESQSGSSTPTISTAPSSPDPESSVGVDGGIQTLLKAIELKTQQQDRTKTPQKRASTGGTTQTRSKKKKESKDGDSSEGVMYQLPMTITSGRPSPASTPGSEKSGQEDNEQLKMPYVGTIDPSTGKFTLVQLRKLHSTPVTSAIQRQETPVSIPVQSPSPEVTVANALRLQPQEQSVTIPLHLIQQELMQKQAPTAVNIATLIAANPTLQSMLMSSGTIPLTVMEKNNQAKLEAQRLVDQKTVTTVTENVGVPIPQVNKNITSIAAALRMANPPTPTSTAVTTMPSSGGLASDPQGIRSKLVSRLMVSGSSMTSPATNVRMPAGIQITAPMATPRPRLDHLLVKPNPSLTLPRTQLQPVKPIDHVVMATATSSNTDVSTAGGPPKLITGSEKTIDLNLNRGIVSMATVSRSKENSALLMSSGLSSPVCTPESRPDILDRQVTIELGKMDKEAQATRPTEDTQHFSDNSSCSKRTVQTQCNMFLWNYLNGKLEDSAKSDPFVIPLLPPKKCKTENSPRTESSRPKPEVQRSHVIKQALDVLRSPNYKVLSFKVIKCGKKKKRALVITNKQYFGTLGHNLDPLTLTLTSNAEVTLNIIFKPVEEFRLLNHDQSFHTELFRDILDRIMSHWFCKGIKGVHHKKDNVISFKYPFRRSQSESCILWFQNEKELSSGKFPVTQCSFCRNIEKSSNIGSGKVKSTPSKKVVVKELYPTEITIKELEKVVVEKIELADTVLEVIPEIPP